LRISDCEQSEDSAIPGTGGFSMNNIKPVSKMNSTEDTPKIHGGVDSTMLNSLLNKMKG
jgi:hypothetical protein